MDEMAIWFPHINLGDKENLMRGELLWTKLTGATKEEEEEGINGIDSKFMTVALERAV
jgi:hypothetical protein